MKIHLTYGPCVPAQVADLVEEFSQDGKSQPLYPQVKSGTGQKAISLADKGASLSCLLS